MSVVEAELLRIDTKEPTDHVLHRNSTRLHWLRSKHAGTGHMIVRLSVVNLYCDREQLHDAIRVYLFFNQHMLTLMNERTNNYSFEIM
jgi:hypothetical protein